MAVAVCWTSISHAEDWTGFRGPGGRAYSESRVPTKWSEDENLAWKTELPGLGSSSPTTLGDSIYLTCYSGYGVEPNEGSQDDLMRYVVCLDRKTGDIKWKREFKPQLPESKYSGGNSSRHGYSSSTIATDGERLYVFFGKSGVYCLDLKGETVWQKSVGANTAGWGSSNSPVLYDNLVIINASVENRSLVALNRMTGEEEWRAGDIRGCWNTPMLLKAGGRDELVLSLPRKVAAFDPGTGKPLWTCEGIPDGGYTCPSAVAVDDVVYVIGGRRNTAIAIRGGGEGDVTESHVIWTQREGSNVSSPIVHDGHLYWAHERSGTVYCLNAKTGEVVKEQRLQPRPGLVYSSVTFAGGFIYAMSQENGVYVLSADPGLEFVSHNTFADSSRSNACPVVDGNRLLLRSDKYLYCVGEN
jgi:hypothetical protein